MHNMNTLRRALKRGNDIIMLNNRYCVFVIEDLDQLKAYVKKHGFPTESYQDILLIPHGDVWHDWRVERQDM